MKSSMDLSKLAPTPGARKLRRRKGRGNASGLGGTSGKGHIGQKARAGGHVRPGFEGGQMPLYRKLPHRGFNQAAFRVEPAVVNVGDLAALDSSVTEVDAAVLSRNGFIRKDETFLKVLGDGEISRALKVTAAKFSASAKAKIEAAGGQAIVA